MGTLETRTLVSRTGGLFVLADKFGQSVFRESLRRAFERVAPTDGSGGERQSTQQPIYMTHRILRHDHFIIGP